MPARLIFRIGPVVISSGLKRDTVPPPREMTRRRWTWSVWAPAVALVVIVGGLALIALTA